MVKDVCVFVCLFLFVTFSGSPGGLGGRGIACKVFEYVYTTNPGYFCGSDKKTNRADPGEPGIPGTNGHS